MKNIGNNIEVDPNGIKTSVICRKDGYLSETHNSIKIFSYG